MHSIRIHSFTARMASLLRCVGIWHGEDRPINTQFGMMSFYCIYYPLFFASFAMGAINQKTLDGSIFLVEASLILAVLTAKFLILVFNQKRIMHLLNRICVFSIRSDEEAAQFTNRVEKFIKFVTVLSWSIFFTFWVNAIFPFLVNTKSLILNIAFPWDYKSSEIGFWTAQFFFVSEMCITVMSLTYSVIVWYLLLHCSLRYKILGADLRNLGQIKCDGKVKLTEKQQHVIFYRDLGELVKEHLQLKESIDELGSFLSKLFLLQFATSGLCMCCSIYCLAFDISDNYVEEYQHVYLLCFTSAELFMITYLGNEIMLSSDCLTYSLFESQWIDQPLATKKCIIVFSEYLKRPHQLVIGKLYPLNLGTFTRIMKSAYSLFNFLTGTKE